MVHDMGRDEKANCYDSGLLCYFLEASVRKHGSDGHSLSISLDFVSFSLDRRAPNSMFFSAKACILFGAGIQYGLVRKHLPDSYIFNS